MKHSVYALASILCLVACNKGPQVNLKNASGNQVAQAVRQSGVMGSDSMIQPGLWESKISVQEMNFPGMPAEYQEKMKQSIAQQHDQGSKHCITEADVKKPKEDFFGADKDCKYDHFTMGGGKIDIGMVCHNEDTTQNMSGKGSYTPTTYSIDTAMTESGGHENGMSMKMHVDAERVGACTGKDDEG